MLYTGLLKNVFFAVGWVGSRGERRSVAVGACVKALRPMSLSSFATLLKRLTTDCDGEQLASLLAISASHPALAWLPAGSAREPAPLAEALSRGPSGAALFPSDASWPRIAACVVCASSALAASPPDALLALGFAREALEELHEPVVEVEDGWVVAPLLRVARDAVALLPAARARASAEDRVEVFQARRDDLMNMMRRRFGDCSRGSGKRSACVAIANIMCRLYFQLHTPRQARFFMDNVDAAKVDLGAFPAGVAVTFRYYAGRLFMYEDRLADANRMLGLAFEQCHKGPAAAAARLRILEALLPVRLLLGRLPSRALLDAYGLAPRYGGIVRGLALGDLAAYRAALEEGMEYFVRRGTYLLLDRLQLLVVRSLVKRLCVCGAAASPAAPPLGPFSYTP